MNTPGDASASRSGAQLTEELPPLSSAGSLHVYRFPVLPDERMSMLVAAIVGAGVAGFSLLQLAQIASDSGASLGQLLAGSRLLRGLLAGMLTIYAVALIAAAGYTWMRGQTELAILHDGIRYRRPPLPVLRLGGYSLRVGWTGVDSVRVQRIRRGLTRSAELEIVAGRDVIRLNLDRATDVHGRRPSAAAPKVELTQHAVVTALVAQRGRPLD